MGRPTKYKEEYVEQAYNLTLLGGDDSTLSRAFGVPESTINAWKVKHLAFRESLKNGKEKADASVGRSLYQRATGYSHPDVDIKMWKGKIIKTDIIKHYPPDSTAMIFWLKNRQKQWWREKLEEAPQPVDITFEFVNKVPEPKE